MSFAGEYEEDFKKIKKEAELSHYPNTIKYGKYYLQDTYGEIYKKIKKEAETKRKEVREGKEYSKKKEKGIDISKYFDNMAEIREFLQDIQPIDYETFSMVVKNINTKPHFTAVEKRVKAYINNNANKDFKKLIDKDYETDIKPVEKSTKLVKKVIESIKEPVKESDKESAKAVVVPIKEIEKIKEIEFPKEDNKKSNVIKTQMNYDEMISKLMKEKEEKLNKLHDKHIETVTKISIQQEKIEERLLKSLTTHKEKSDKLRKTYDDRIEELNEAKREGVSVATLRKRIKELMNIDLSHVPNVSKKSIKSSTKPAVQPKNKLENILVNQPQEEIVSLVKIQPEVKVKKEVKTKKPIVQNLELVSNLSDTVLDDVKKEIDNLTKAKWNATKLIDKALFGIKLIKLFKKNKADLANLPIYVADSLLNDKQKDQVKLQNMNDDYSDLINYLEDIGKIKKSTNYQKLIKAGISENNITKHFEDKKFKGNVEDYVNKMKKKSFDTLLSILKTFSK